MARTPGEGMAGSEWVKVGAACLPGLVVGLVISWSDGRGSADARAQQQLAEVVVKIAEMSQRLTLVCDQIEEKNRTLDEIRKEQKILSDRVTRLEMRR